MTPDTIKLAEAQRRAEAAKTLFENEALQDAFARLEATYTHSWKTSEPHKAEEREIIFYRLQALDALKKDLEATIAGGKITAYNMRSRLK